MGFDESSNGMAYQYLTAMGRKYGFTMDTPVSQISEEGRHAILYGTGEDQVTIEYQGARGPMSYSTAFEGVIPTMERRYRETSSEGMREAYEEYMAEEICPACRGSG